MGRPHLVIGFVLACASLAWGASASAQSALDISLEDYLKEAGPDAKLIAAGKLTMAGRRLICGRRPAVMDPNFDSWGGAYPGFIILNPRRLEGLSPTIKFYVYAHECAHQFVGRDEAAADCFAMRRGRLRGWLNQDGLEEICTFISQLKGDDEHAPGVERCKAMRQCFKQAGSRAGRQN